MSSETYNAVIIGPGRIGCGFDTPDSPHVLTHAHAISLCPRLKLAAIVGIEPSQKSVAETWKTEFFDDAEAMYAQIKPDLVVIATPNETHAGLLLQAIARSPRAIICEKPVVSTSEEASRVRAADSDAVSVIVNFSRRFDSVVARVRDELLRGDYGKVLCASSIYYKGIMHNGSHMIDLARYLFGEMTGAKAYSSVDDFPEGLPSISAFLSFERCKQFALVAADARDYALFELDIVAQKKRIRFIDGGSTLVESDIIDDPLYAGFRIPGEPRVSETGIAHSLEALMDHAVAVMDGAEPSRSSLAEGLSTNAACLAIVESLKGV